MKKLSIVIPVYNEHRFIRTIVDRVRSAGACGLDKEIIVVDDGSSDGTRESLASMEFPDVKVLLHERNRGKGAALRTGFLEATGDVVLIQDADLEYTPEEYPVLLAPILHGHADVVYGSRFLGGPHRVHLFWHMVGNRFLTLLSNMMSNLNLTDMETCYKVFRRDVIRGMPLRSDRFGFEPEITAKISRIENVRIYEVGISYYGRQFKEGKKINWKDGVRAVWCILKYNLFR